MILYPIQSVQQGLAHVLNGGPFRKFGLCHQATYFKPVKWRVIWMRTHPLPVKTILQFNLFQNMQHWKTNKTTQVNNKSRVTNDIQWRNKFWKGVDVKLYTYKCLPLWTMWYFHSRKHYIPCLYTLFWVHCFIFKHNQPNNLVTLWSGDTLWSIWHTKEACSRRGLNAITRPVSRESAWFVGRVRLLLTRYIWYQCFHVLGVGVVRFQETE